MGEGSCKSGGSTYLQPSTHNTVVTLNTHRRATTGRTWVGSPLVVTAKNINFKNQEAGFPRPLTHDHHIKVSLAKRSEEHQLGRGHASPISNALAVAAPRAGCNAEATPSYFSVGAVLPMAGGGGGLLGVRRMPAAGFTQPRKLAELIKFTEDYSAPICLNQRRLQPQMSALSKITTT